MRINVDFTHLSLESLGNNLRYRSFIFLNFVVACFSFAVTWHQITLPQVPVLTCIHSKTHAQAKKGKGGNNQTLSHRTFYIVELK